MEILKTLVERGDLGPARARLRTLARSETDYLRFATLCRWHDRLTARDPASGEPGAGDPLRVALLGGASMDLVEKPLRLALEAAGLATDLFRADYGVIAREMLDPDSATARFRPEVAVVAPTVFDVSTWPAVGSSPEEAAEAVERVVDEWLRLAGSLHDRVGCDVVLNNFHPLPTRPLGSAGTRIPWDRNRFLREVNHALAARAPAYVHINDVATLASLHGVLRWFDHRFWYHAKQPVSLECMVPYVRSMAQVVGALRGKSAKCVVVDLDNTLWGGVVGDDGVEGLRIGEGDAVAESHKAFQSYLKELGDRGVILAVCSKNEEANALEPFDVLPDMVLRRADFAAFRANWSPKSENIVEIARQLNIGLDSIVFVDDNPAERAEVRRAIPDVRVVELPDDPADYPLALDATGWFETVALSDEDRVRGRLYRENAQREALKSETLDYEGYLESLDQIATVGVFDETSMERITQLTNKTNQFNLTTRRLTRTELERYRTDPGKLGLHVRLADRFGDNGLISVAAGHLDGDTFVVDLWLMSCRVFGRGVEHLMANRIAEGAARLGAARIRGLYRPTAKNGLVAELYPSLGFAAVEGAVGEWVIDLDDYRPFQPAIRVAEPANGVESDE